MVKGFFIATLMFFSVMQVLHADTNDTLPQYINPIKGNLKLSGSFGELRSGHFHTGIDIKSNNTYAGDSIFCIANGWVSRIKIDRVGYGIAVYVDHPETGHTSLYAHLSATNPEIDSIIFNLQKQLKSWELDVFFEKDKIPLGAGELIGFLGNTGYSLGPHLHFEIRDTKSEKVLNPFLFGIKPTDTRSPIALSMDIYGLDYSLQVIDRQTKYSPKNKNSGVLNFGIITVPAYRAGIGVQCFDLMNGASNYNGIYRLEMKVDGNVEYVAQFDTLEFDYAKQINAYIDYHSKIEKDRSVSCCYKKPGNQLSLITTATSQGLINLYPDRTRNVEVNISDIEGNKTTINLKLVAANTIKHYEGQFQKFLKCAVDTTFISQNWQFHFPKEALAIDLPFNFKMSRINDEDIYQICEESTPLLCNIEGVIPVQEHINLDISKLRLVRIEKEGLADYGSEIIDSTLRVSLAKFGNYKFFVDTIAPVIKKVEFPKKSKTGMIFKFEISDKPFAKNKGKDIHYNIYVDDQWYPGAFKDLTHSLTIDTRRMDIGIHKLRIEVTDGVGNVSEYEGSFELY